jgi:hypothetical protein
MQKHLDDLLCEDGAVLLRDLDRLQQVQIHHRGADWLVRIAAVRALPLL